LRASNGHPTRARPAFAAPHSKVGVLAEVLPGHHTSGDRYGALAVGALETGEGSNPFAERGVDRPDIDAVDIPPAADMARP
jgi:hypothetical protein